MSMYIILHHGDPDSVWATPDKDHALNECRESVFQYVGDFLRHDLPMKVTPSDEARFDIRLIEVCDREVGSALPAACSEVELPFQEWVDEYYAELREQEKAEELAKRDPEWETYVRLRKKFSGVY